MKSVKIRTDEEILAQLEARRQELDEIANEPSRLFPCRTCRHSSGQGTYLKCHNHLIVGFNEPKYVWAWDGPESLSEQARLCGPEKALWLPLTGWKRLRREHPNLTDPFTLTLITVWSFAITVLALTIFS